MSRQQRVRRTMLASLALGSAVVWMVTVLLLVVDRPGVPVGALLTVLWLSGLAALILTVAACRVADDSIDDPEYFGSLVTGLRSEWQRSGSRL